MCEWGMFLCVLKKKEHYAAMLMCMTLSPAQPSTYPQSPPVLPWSSQVQEPRYKPWPSVNVLNLLVSQSTQFSTTLVSETLIVQMHYLIKLINQMHFIDWVLFTPATREVHGFGYISIVKTLKWFDLYSCYGHLSQAPFISNRSFCVERQTLGCGWIFP